MSVTDNATVAGAVAKSRNMPYGDRPPSMALYRTEVCGRCFGRIEPDEPVWMGSWCSYWSEYSGRYIHRAYAATCSDCRGIEFRWHKVSEGVWADGDFYPDYWYEGACETCGRTVFKERRYMRRRFFCGESCRGSFYSRQRRGRKPEKVCEVCGEAFTASRRDAKTCSRACKQKAYRQRKQGA